jgi:ABC-2 type transport system ATP-binding protein
MGANAIELVDLTRRYGGRLAVDQLNLTIAPGEVFGFVGPNGAGKTTTLRMIAGLLPPTSGEVFVAGNSVRCTPEAVRRQIGYMPDFFGVYPELRVGEYLEFFAACYNIPESERPGLISGLLDLVDLAHREQDQVDRLSRGMKQRLSLARALIHDPAVLLLDEPASGLDPRARVEIRELLVELSRMGKTIFFSTHILADVAEICTQVGIIEAGRLVAQGSLDALRGLVMPRRRIEVTLLGEVEDAEAFLGGLDSVAELQRPPEANGNLPRLVFEFAGDDAALSGLLAGLVQAGLPVLNFNEDRRDLEEVFLRATKGLVS